MAIRRKSASVPLGVTALLASALLSGCGASDPEYDAVCVDPNTQVRLDDDYCDDDTHYHHGGGWYYIASGRSYPPVGSKASGGSFASPGPEYTVRRGGLSTAGGTTKSSSVFRGGFGGSSGKAGS